MSGRLRRLERQRVVTADIKPIGIKPVDDQQRDKMLEQLAEVTELVKSGEVTTTVIFGGKANGDYKLWQSPAQSRLWTMGVLFQAMLDRAGVE
jgi:hypothetical protein